MTIGVFDLFKIGVGPSSSHTVGPMVAARTFAATLAESDALAQTVRVRAELFGSLGATGRGHGSPKAVLLGLEGETPEEVDVEKIADRVAAIRKREKINLAGRREIDFHEREDLILHKRKSLPLHPNGMIFRARDSGGAEILTRAYYSVGGGFVLDQDQAGRATGTVSPAPEDSVPLPFHSGAELMRRCDESGLSVAGVMMENEKARAPESEIRERLLRIWAAMRECVSRGCRTEGVLPGGLEVRRRAAGLRKKLEARLAAGDDDPLIVSDWLSVYALAVNEENAAGGRVVTAPTNGAAGVVPAVLHYYMLHRRGDESGAVDFLLAAAAVGALFKENASISGAEVGCQGEVGSACAMAAAGLAEVSGATPRQLENAAEIAMEHNLGLTCDPIGGLVQIPCIERNAIAANKAVNAARMALAGDGAHFVSLDKVIKVMRETGRDMKDKYKETARGGLATGVMEVPVNIVEC